MTTTGKILTAFTVGAAAGVVLGILFAPAKGSETRQKISDQGKKFSDSIKEKIQRAKANCNDLKEDLKSAVRESVNDFEEA